MRRSLSLNKETLAELTSYELGIVAGGQKNTEDCPHVSDVCMWTYQVQCLLSRAMDPCLVTGSADAC